MKIFWFCYALVIAAIAVPGKSLGQSELKPFDKSKFELNLGLGEYYPGMVWSEPIEFMFTRTESELQNQPKAPGNGWDDVPSLISVQCPTEHHGLDCPIWKALSMPASDTVLATASGLALTGLLGPIGEQPANTRSYDDFLDRLSMKKLLLVKAPIKIRSESLKQGLGNLPTWSAVLVGNILIGTGIWWVVQQAKRLASGRTRTKDRPLNLSPLLNLNHVGFSVLAEF